MKVHLASNQPTGFKPVTLEFTFDSMKELEVMYGVFNWLPLTSLIRDYLYGSISYQESEPMDATIRESCRILGNNGKLISGNFFDLLDRDLMEKK